VNKIRIPYQKMKESTIYFDNVVDEVTYYIGTSAADNFAVIDKGGPDDYWFHASDCSSCHVVVNVPEHADKRELKTIIKKGALLCKQNTSKLAKLQNVTVVYTKVKYITKTDVSGCVTLKNEKTITC
jgi:predicted ribosome quality control (RQC) complex YloA/Tae2 family protein